MKKPSESEMREWAALPRDIVLEILGRLQHADILRGAGLACAPWWRAAVEEPTLWRAIDVDFNKGDRVDRQAWEGRMAMGRAAVDRSAGRCESFRGIADRDFLAYLAARAPSLRILEVTSLWCLPEEFFDRVIPKLPLLERLVISGGPLLKSTLVGLFQHCPRLRVLDARDCYIDEPIGPVIFKWRRKMEVLWLPGWGCCQFCVCMRCLLEEPPRRGREDV